MTDPRIAALAEAIRTGYWAQTPEPPPDWATLDNAEEWYASPNDMAAYILAALPPDWCGHTDMVSREAALDIVRREGQRVATEVREVSAEIARLRRIEEAARGLLCWVDDESITLCTICHTECGHFPECPMPALRAALEEKP
jgi:hypothetical protein